MPSNAQRFFWLNCLVLALGLINSILMAPKNAAIASAGGHGLGFVIGIQIFVAAFILLLLWLIAFRRQNWARWLFVGMFVLGMPLFVATFKSVFGGITISAAISLVQVMLQLAGLYFIFTGNARPWFRRETEAS
jgi:hypothetical protein